MTPPCSAQNSFGFLAAVRRVTIRRLRLRFRLRRNGRLVHSADDLCGRLDGVIRVDGHLTVLAVVAEIIALDRLVDEQILRKAGQKIGVLAQQRLTLGIRLIEDVLDLFVDRSGSLLGVALRRAEVAADEDAVARGIEADGAATWSPCTA